MGIVSILCIYLRCYHPPNPYLVGLLAPLQKRPDCRFKSIHWVQSRELIPPRLPPRELAHERSHPRFTH